MPVDPGVATPPASKPATGPPSPTIPSLRRSHARGECGSANAQQIVDRVDLAGLDQQSRRARQVGHRVKPRLAP